MGLWARLTRVFRASTGAALDRIENPELVLQQTIRDMRDRVPELNNSVAQVMATERLLARNKENLAKQVVDLDSKIKASVKMGRDDIATAYIGQLQQAQLDLERTSAQLELAGAASKNALKARDNYVLKARTTITSTATSSCQCGYDFLRRATFADYCTLLHLTAQPR